MSVFGGGGGGVGGEGGVVCFKEEPKRESRFQRQSLRKPGNVDVDLEKCSLKLSKAN